MKEVLFKNLIIIAVTLTLLPCHLNAQEQQADSLKTVALEEVVATGTRVTADPRLLPMTVSVIGTPQLENRTSVNILPAVMEQVPGLFVTNRGMMGYSVSTGGSGAIKMRGIGGTPNTDVLVLIDGLPQYAGLYGHPIADSYQSMTAERVEVVRGPASLFYGSNAMGGVLNIVTKHPHSDTIMTHLHLRGGSYYTIDAGAHNQIKKNRFTSTLAFNYNRTDGHRDNMKFTQYNGTARIAYELNKNWTMTAAGNVSFFSTANPGTTEAPIEDGQYDILRGMASLSAENKYADVRFPTSGAIRIYYNGGKHKIDEGHAPEAEPAASTYMHTDFLAGLSAYQTTTFSHGNRTTFGFDYQHFGGHAWNTFNNGSPDAEIIRKTQYELAIYADFSQEVTSWFALDAGARIDWHSEAGLAYAPQGGVIFTLPKKAQIKALASRGFRNPTIRELYMYKPANSKLNPVSLWNYEIAYKQRMLNNRISLGVNVFYLHAKDNIETRMVDGKPLNVNSGELRNAGVEAEISYNVWKGLSLQANYCFLHMENPVTAAPKHKFFFNISYSHDRFIVSTSVLHINRLYTSVGDNAQTENFTLWNAGAAVRIWKGLWAEINAENLLAQEYEINAGFPMPKTTIMGGLKWNF